MPVYQVDIEKQSNLPTGQTFYWTNVYHTNQSSQANAVTWGNSVVTIEKAVHAASVTFTRMRVRPAGVPGNVGTIVVLTGTGGRGTIADGLPPYCTVRVDMSKAVGRPCRKYLRVVIGETEQTNGLLTTAFASSMNTNYLTPLLALGSLCDEDGDLVTGGAISSPVQMRQLRRGSKRKVLPVI